MCALALCLRFHYAHLFFTGGARELLLFLGPSGGGGKGLLLGGEGGGELLQVGRGGDGLLRLGGEGGGGLFRLAL